MEVANIETRMDRIAYTKAPSDRETEPDVIWRKQLREVRNLVKLGVSDEQELSNLTDLPIWSIRRALCIILTGKKWKFPTPADLRESARKSKRFSRNALFSTPVWEKACPTHQKSTAVSGSAPSRKAKKKSGGSPRALKTCTKRPTSSLATAT